MKTLTLLHFKITGAGEEFFLKKLGDVTSVITVPSSANEAFE